MAQGEQYVCRRVRFGRNRSPDLFFKVQPRPFHALVTGGQFGGQLMQWIDIVAAVVARRHSNCNVTTAAIERLEFKAPAYANNTVVLDGRITYAGRTSMEVRVDTFKEEKDKINIHAVIYVERDSQKGIIIGHRGVALKKMSTEARKALEKFFGKHIYLETYVKVDKDWRSSKRELDHFGYNPE